MRVESRLLNSIRLRFLCVFMKCLKFNYMALIKRLLSRRNTSPSQRLLFSCRTSLRSLPWSESSSRFLRPIFLTLWFRALYCLPGTHQVQACTKDKFCPPLVQALVRKADPRKNISTFTGKTASTESRFAKRPSVMVIGKGFRNILKASSRLWSCMIWRKTLAKKTILRINIRKSLNALKGS